MDTSETYIKMCEMSTEIQKDWKPQNGDFCWHDNEGDDIYGVWEFPAEKSIVNITKEKSLDWWLNWLWLPHQDQLQEMVMPCKNSETIAYYLSTIKNFNEPSRQFKTMEQLWLAFVMKEKYNKVWDSENWDKIKTGVQG